jgi:hypothetical protein
MHVRNRRLLAAAVVAAAAGTRIVGPSIDVAAQGSTPSAAPSNEVPCDAFSKNPDGSWTARRPVTVKIGSSSVTVNASTYGRNAINVNGVDFAGFLDASCSEPRPAR